MKNRCEKIIICILLFIIFSCMMFVGLKIQNKHLNSNYCEYGRPLIQDGKLIACEHIDGYISNPVYDDNGLMEALLVIGALGISVVIVWSYLIIVDY